jgi:hypothetical protein
MYRLEETSFKYRWLKHNCRESERYPKKKKAYIGNKLSYTYPVYVIGKENSESFFLCPAYAHAPSDDLR